MSLWLTRLSRLKSRLQEQKHALTHTVTHTRKHAHARTHTPEASQGRRGRLRSAPGVGGPELRPARQGQLCPLVPSLGRELGTGLRGPGGEGGGGGGSGSGCEALGARPSAARRHPRPQPAAARSPSPPPEARPAPNSIPSSASPRRCWQPMASRGAGRATRPAANCRGPLGGQPPGIGQLPAAPAPARLLFVTAAPWLRAPQPKRGAQHAAAGPGEVEPLRSATHSSRGSGMAPHRAVHPRKPPRPTAITSPPGGTRQ